MALDLPSPAACIFDLDGTLIDSLQDIAESANECLELLGLLPRPVVDFRYLVGDGVPKLCQRAIGATHPHLVPRLSDLVRARYRTRPLRHTVPYEGVPALIGRLSERGMPLAVLTNKPHEITLRIVAALWPGRPFGAVYGYQQDEYRKPHPRFAQQICDELGVRPQDTWVIGDTPTDVETARRLGAVSIGVTWGFRERADLEAAGAVRIVDRPEELG